MDRRAAVMALAAAAAGTGWAGRAFAQGAVSAGSAEMEHAQRTAQVGHLALETSDVALEKAHGARTKEFAKFEHDEQTTVAEILKSMNPDLPAPKLDAKGEEMMTKLKGASGAAFDRAYVAGQIEGHEMLLKIQETCISSGKDPNRLAVAKLVRGMVKEHLTLLSDLHKAVG